MDPYKNLDYRARYRASPKGRENQRKASAKWRRLNPKKNKEVQKASRARYLLKRGIVSKCKKRLALMAIAALRTESYGDVPLGQLPSTDCMEADQFRKAIAIAEKALE